MDKHSFSMREKRKFDRNQLYYYLKVHNEKTDMLIGYLADISTEGLMLFSKEGIEPDTMFCFRIKLDKAFDMEGDLVFEARSRWCEKDANPEYYITGFKFVDLDQANTDTVKYLIKKYGSGKG